MMRIGIISDTHDKWARTSQAIKTLVAEGAEVIIHCGDITEHAIVHECAAGGVPCHFVFGNNDYDKDALRRAMEEVGANCLEKEGEIVLAGKRIAITHGDRKTLMDKLLRLEPHYLLSGHTHIPTDVWKGPVRCINPGALHRADVWTVAILDLEKDELHHISITGP